MRDIVTRTASALVAALLLWILLSLGSVEQVPAFLPFALLGLAALTAWEPSWGLPVLAGLIPIASWGGRGWNFYVAWAEALVIATAAGWFIRAAWKPREPDELDRPIQVFSLVVVASLAVFVALVNWRMTGEPFPWTAGETFKHFFVVRRAGDPTDAAMRLLECMFLLRASSAAARRTPEFALRLAQWAVAGATAAAALNLWRLWEGARRSDAPVATFIRYVATIRENIHYADLNAAGSYFVLVLFTAAGLALLPRQKKWIVPAIVIAVALWLTGSRAALLAGMLALLLPAALAARSMSRRRMAVAFAGVSLALVGCAAAAAHYLPTRGNQHSSLEAVLVRWELLKTSVRMTASHPIFGVGVGQYYHLSGDFSSEELLRLFPVARNENAHNNFLQILAELGIVGFAAFMWLLAIAGSGILRLRAKRERETSRHGRDSTADERFRWALACGLAAFLFTCLAGHPLLTDEPAFMFWLMLGGAAGSSIAARSARPGKVRRYGFAIVVIAMLLVIPLRVKAQIAEADMEHAGFGLSAWQTAPDGSRYRFSTGRSTVFLPAQARAVSIPVRAIGTPRMLQLFFDGRPADIVSVPSDEWHALHLSLPVQPTSPTRFRRLDIQAVGVHPSEEHVFMVGKVEAR